MKTILNGIFAGIVLCGVAFAQNTTPPESNGATSQDQQAPTTAQPAQPSSAQASGTLRIAPGSVIPVQLTKSVDAKKVKTGDEVEAKVTQDLKAGSGEVVVPKDTKVVGRVTEAQVRSKEQKESQIGIAFDHAVMKNGVDAQLPLSIQAIIAPSALNADNSNNSGAGDAGQPSSATAPGGMSPSGGGGRSTGMGQGAPPQTPTPSANSSEQAPGAAAGSAHEPITGNTQGVVGISNLKLSAGDATQGSIVSSEKGNVKLDSGTLMLLRVNQANQ